MVGSKTFTRGRPPTASRFREHDGESGDSALLPSDRLVRGEAPYGWMTIFLLSPPVNFARAAE